MNFQSFICYCFCFSLIISFTLIDQIQAVKFSSRKIEFREEDGSSDEELMKKAKKWDVPQPVFKIDRDYYVVNGLEVMMDADKLSLNADYVYDGSSGTFKSYRTRLLGCGISSTNTEDPKTGINLLANCTFLPSQHAQHTFFMGCLNVLDEITGESQVKCEGNLLSPKNEDGTASAVVPANIFIYYYIIDIIDDQAHCQLFNIPRSYMLYAELSGTYNDLVDTYNSLYLFVGAALFLELLGSLCFAYREYTLKQKNKELEDQLTSYKNQQQQKNEDEDEDEEEKKTK